MLMLGMNHGILYMTLGISIIRDVLLNRLHLNDQETYLHHQRNYPAENYLEKNWKCRVQGV